ncbi:MAG: tyrosine-type recombinase/integrase [Myxococcota bacterium]
MQFIFDCGYTNANAGRVSKESEKTPAVLIANYLAETAPRLSPATREAKRHDLDKLARFLIGGAGCEHTDMWTPRMLAAFRRHLQASISSETGRGYQPATVRRIMATASHFSRWVRGHARGVRLSKVLTEYLTEVAATACHNTHAAKQRDLALFQSFFHRHTSGDLARDWTSEITKAFQRSLATRVSPATGRPYKAATVNRVLATVLHCARWMHERFPPTKELGPPPVQGVHKVPAEPPRCRALSEKQTAALLCVCSTRVRRLRRDKRRNPLLEAAVVHVLAATGLRVGELVALNTDQYRQGCFFRVRRKGGRVTFRVRVPSRARRALDAFLREAGGGSGPLFRSRLGRRLSCSRVRQLCRVLSRRASAELAPRDRFHLTPHMLRHTCVKRATTVGGITYGHAVSGNVSCLEVFRYAQLTQLETWRLAGRVFGDGGRDAVKTLPEAVSV